MHRENGPRRAPQLPRWHRAHRAVVRPPWRRWPYRLPVLFLACDVSCLSSLCLADSIGISLSAHGMPDSTFFAMSLQIKSFALGKTDADTVWVRHHWTMVARGCTLHVSIRG